MSESEDTKLPIDLKVNSIRAKKILVEDELQVGIGGFRISMMANDHHAMLFVFGRGGNCEFASLQACKGQADGAPILVVGSDKGSGHDFCVGGTNDKGEMLFQLGVPKAGGDMKDYIHVSMGELIEAVKTYRTLKPAIDLPTKAFLTQSPPKQEN